MVVLIEEDIQTDFVRIENQTALPVSNIDLQTQLNCVNKYFTALEQVWKITNSAVNIFGTWTRQLSVSLHGAQAQNNSSPACLKLHTLHARTSHNRELITDM
jgi:hypothetical protein